MSKQKDTAAKKQPAAPAKPVKAAMVAKPKGPKPDYKPRAKGYAPTAPARREAVPSGMGHALAIAVLQDVRNPLAKRVCANLEDGVGVSRV